MITTDVEPLEEILSSRDAELLSCALKHRRVTEMKLTDPYFTDEEWERVLDNRAELLDDADDLLDGLGTSATQETGSNEKGEFHFAHAKRTSAIVISSLTS